MLTFSDIFSKQLGIFSPNFTHLLNVQGGGVDSHCRKRSESGNLRQATVFNFVKTHISCQNYFCYPAVCQTAKFGEDTNVLKHSRTVAVGNFQCGVFDVEIRLSGVKFVTRVLNVCAKFHQIELLLFEKLELRA